MPNFQWSLEGCVSKYLITLALRACWKKSLANYMATCRCTRPWINCWEKGLFLMSVVDARSYCESSGKWSLQTSWSLNSSSVRENISGWRYITYICCSLRWNIFKVKAFGESGQWTELNALAKTKKSPIGFAPFLDVCLKQVKSVVSLDLWYNLRVREHKLPSTSHCWVKRTD